MSTLQAANIQALSSATLPVIKDSAGTEYGRFCRAFVQFNGSTNTINSSFNVSSSTKNGTGDWTISFTNALSDANYCHIYGARDLDNGWGVPTIQAHPSYTPSTTSLRIAYNYPPNGTLYDAQDICVAIFR